MLTTEALVADITEEKKALALLAAMAGWETCTRNQAYGQLLAKSGCGRVAVAGDSVGGNMVAVVTQLAKERKGPAIRARLFSIR